PQVDRDLVHRDPAPLELELLACVGRLVAAQLDERGRLGILVGEVRDVRDRAPHVQRAERDHHARDLDDAQEPLHVVGNPRHVPRGNAASIAAIAPSSSTRSPAPAHSSTCATFAAFGIANSDSRRVRYASATCREVAPNAFATPASTTPSRESSSATSFCPNGLYATTGTPCFSHHGKTSYSIVRSPR